jgi:hypothetical protein
LSASAKIFLLAAEVRRGDKESDAMDIGDGSAICTSTGDSTTVFERLKGVLVSFLGCLFALAVGDSIDNWLMSVLEGKPVSSPLLTDD